MMFHEMESGAESNADKREKSQRVLTFDIKSRQICRVEEAETKCLIRLHNCTAQQLNTYWIDCSGKPIGYPTLKRGESLNIDTYVSHLWFFTSTRTLNVKNRERFSATKILAVPEESLKISSALMSGPLMSCFSPTRPDVGDSLPRDRHLFQDELLGLNNMLICSLCKFVLKQYSRVPVKIPCQHFRGESKFSISDLDHRSLADFNSIRPYIYSCSDDTHCKSHARQRRNLYLVEMFPNLRERCFLTLKGRVSQDDVTDLDLPLSLQQEYVQFITTLKKLESNKLI